MRVALVGGAYQARSLIASAQRCVNLYAETNPADSQAPVPVTHYLTPGLTLLASAPNKEAVRQVYRATNGDLYVVVGQTVYFVSPLFVFTALGTIPDLTTPVSLSDNGLVIVLVDGTNTGYAIDMASRAFGKINDPNFLGANFVDYIDTFFVFNKPGTNELYISLSEVNYTLLTTSGAFNALDIAAKTGSADPIARVTVVHREVWPIGALTSEVWIDSGAADFALQPLPGAFVEHGCVAPFSVANWDNSPFWLSQDRQGRAVVVKGHNYTVERISTHAIETLLQSYATISDAIGFIFQQEGHVFYAITLPSADVTWMVDLQTGQWLQWASMDNNGVLHRVRANCCCFAYGLNIVGDYQNGNLYSLDPNNYTDNGNPILRLRSFPHLLNDGKRMIYTSFIADLQVGTQTPADSSNPPMVRLRWSDDRGATYGNPVDQSMGAGGQYLTSIKWSRCGMSRDRVFELSWSAAVNCSLNGAFVEGKPQKS